MDQLFEVHMLNETGKTKATQIASAFERLLDTLQTIWVQGNNNAVLGSREQHIVEHELEVACFYAKKAMAIQKVNQG